MVWAAMNSADKKSEPVMVRESRSDEKIRASSLDCGSGSVVKTGFTEDLPAN